MFVPAVGVQEGRTMQGGVRENVQEERQGRPEENQLHEEKH